MSSVAPLEIRVGARLPGTKYTIVRRMGEGGMGVVFEVEKPPAIRGAAKLLAPDLCNDQGFRTRFLNEAHILAQIEHPNIVRVYDYDVLPDGRPFFVMELLKGKPLDAALREESTLPPRIALRVMRQLLSALHCAHTHSTPLVHRDVKPGNVFFHKPTHAESVVKLLDFGISSALNAKTAMAGTHGYMAPEQLHAAPVTAQTDLYASAVVLFEMLTGHGPFPTHDKMGLESLQYATLEVSAPRITRYAPWVPEPVADAIASALEKDPRRRPTSALDFAEALQALDSIDGAALGRSDEWTPAPASFSAALRSPSTEALVPPPSPRKLDTFASHESGIARARTSARWRWMAGGMLGVSACASVAIVLFAGRPPVPSRPSVAGRVESPPSTSAVAPPGVPSGLQAVPTSDELPTPTAAPSTEPRARSSNAHLSPIPRPSVTASAPPKSIPAVSPPASSADAIRTL